MPTTGFSDEQVMLTLACCSYLGFDLFPGTTKERKLRELTSKALATLAPVKERWDLVWGPASYRAPMSAFDDGAMFVARERRQPSRYVVSIRGTNPVSIFDWVFGDFHVGRQLEWPYGDPAATVDARISFSAALGLDILQHLRAGSPSDSAHPDSIKDAAKGLFDHPSDTLRVWLKQLGTQLNDTRKRFSTRLELASGLLLKAHLKRLAAAWRPDELHSLFAPLDDAGTLPGKGGFDLLRFTEGGAQLRSQFEGGEDLLSFLTRIVENADTKLEIIVTGHSKGGALSATAALWLADTQGAAEWVQADQRWDPERKATIGCYSFAGPTAGNSAFVAHSDQVIGDHCRRVANTLDVVTNAWQVDDLRRIPTLYEPEVHPPLGLARLAKLVAAATGDLGYTQIGKHVRLLHPPLDPDKEYYPAQLVYQHLQAYINELGLSDHMSQKTFFKF